MPSDLRISAFAAPLDDHRNLVVINVVTGETVMSHFILVRHKVRDFNTWKAAFDADRPMRTETGLTETKLLRGAEDPNEIILLMEVKDLNRAKAMMASPELRQTMQAAGVVDKPDIYFLNG
jgi:hypothetical protein